MLQPSGIHRRAPRSASALSSASARDVRQPATSGGGPRRHRRRRRGREAKKYLGLPYVWGGTDPQTGMDCSGLVQLVYKKLGYDLPRVSADQARAGRPVASMAEAQPGDLIAWDNSSRNNGVDHIAIYIGDGKMIEAPRTGLERPHRRRAVHPRRDPPDPARRPGRRDRRLSASAAPRPVAPAVTPYADLFNAAPAASTASRRPALRRRQAGVRLQPEGRQLRRRPGPDAADAGTAQGLGVTDPFDPNAGRRRRRPAAADLLNRFGRTDLGLAAYNAGPGAVLATTASRRTRDPELRPLDHVDAGGRHMSGISMSAVPAAPVTRPARPRGRRRRDLRVGRVRHPVAGLLGDEAATDAPADGTTRRRPRPGRGRGPRHRHAGARRLPRSCPPCPAPSTPRTRRARHRSRRPARSSGPAPPAPVRARSTTARCPAPTAAPPASWSRARTHRPCPVSRSPRSPRRRLLLLRLLAGHRGPRRARCSGAPAARRCRRGSDGPRTPAAPPAASVAPAEAAALPATAAATEPMVAPAPAAPAVVVPTGAAQVAPTAPIAAPAALPRCTPDRRTSPTRSPPRCSPRSAGSRSARAGAERHPADHAEAAPRGPRRRAGRADHARRRGDDQLYAAGRGRAGIWRGRSPSCAGCSAASGASDADRRRTRPTGVRRAARTELCRPAGADGSGRAAAGRRPAAARHPATEHARTRGGQHRHGWHRTADPGVPRPDRSTRSARTRSAGVDVTM